MQPLRALAFSLIAFSAGAAPIAAPSIPVRSLQFPLLSQDDAADKTFDNIELRGFAADGALVYVTNVFKDDEQVCENGRLTWDLYALATERGGKTDLYRLPATMDTPYGGKPVTVDAATLQAARKKKDCDEPDPEIAANQSLAAGADSVLAALGPLTPICDLSKPGCKGPQGLEVALFVKRGKAKFDGRADCRDSRIGISLGTKVLFHEQGRDCERDRKITAKIAFSQDGKRAAIAWQVQTRGDFPNMVQRYGRLDIIAVP